jgi:hypothetical protein
MDQNADQEVTCQRSPAAFTPTKAFSCLRASSRSSRYSRNFAQAMRQVATLVFQADGYAHRQAIGCPCKVHLEFCAFGTHLVRS